MCYAPKYVECVMHQVQIYKCVMHQVHIYKYDMHQIQKLCYATILTDPKLLVFTTYSYK